MADEIATRRHKKRGSTYIFIGFGRMQAEDWRRLNGPFFDDASDLLPADMAEVAIYQAVEDGSLWVRPREEWEDGRFEPI